VLAVVVAVLPLDGVHNNIGSISIKGTLLCHVSVMAPGSGRAGRRVTLLDVGKIAYKYAAPAVYSYAKRQGYQYVKRRLEDAIDRYTRPNKRARVEEPRSVYKNPVLSVGGSRLGSSGGVVAMSGKYTRMARRGRRPRMPKYQCVTRDHRFGTVDQGTSLDDAVYIGFGTHPPKQVFIHLCNSLILHFFKDAGIHVRSINQNFADLLSNEQLVISWRFCPREGTATTVQTFASGTNVTLYEAALAWANVILQFCTEFSNGFRIEKALIWLRDATTTTTNYTARKEYDLTGAQVAIRSTAIMYYQNNTAANDAVAGDLDAENVKNSPIHCRVFYMKGLYLHPTQSLACCLRHPLAVRHS